MYHTIYLDERVALTPAEINNVHKADDVKDMLVMKLKERHESKCNANGYVKPDSIELVARSAGAAENGRYTGNFVYDCKMKCDVLYPKGGMVMPVLVIKVTKMGVYAVFEEAIRVLVPRDIHIGNTVFDSIKEGDMIKVRLERSEIKTNAPFIMAVGKLVEGEEVEGGEGVEGNKGAESGESSPENA